MSNGQPKRRGYVRPQGTNFAASAQSRESVLSLGSIAHIQYYFARTGLLDGKGGQLAKKKTPGNRDTLDLSVLDTSFLNPATAYDRDSSYSSMGSSPELLAEGLVESPTDADELEPDYYSDDENHPHMLPPTASTYIYREKPLAKPPDLVELKEELKRTLNDARAALQEAKGAKVSESPIGAHRREGSIAPDAPLSPGVPVSPATPKSPAYGQGWYELQGMHILDIMTLAIRAAKMYYTAHDNPTRLSSIKSERKIRADLLSVMEVLKRMATRSFNNGMKVEEREVMENWVAGVDDMLAQETELEKAERELWSGWTWLADTWEDRPLEREYAFLKAMDPEADSLPPFSTASESSELPTPLLSSMQSGLRLIKVHNAIVKKSRRPFGAISTFHTDTMKPYRCADNLRYWIKAAELDWEIVLKVDVMGVVTGTDEEAWKGFETAIWTWCKAVREMLSTEIKV
jgi:hypothetical protein